MKDIRDYLDSYGDEDIIAPKLESMDGTPLDGEDIAEYTAPKDINQTTDSRRIIAVAHGDGVDTSPMIEEMDGTPLSDEDIRQDALREAEPVRRTEMFPPKPKVDLYEGKQYKDNLGMLDAGEKIARVVGIIVIVLAVPAIINSFISGGMADFLTAAVRIAAAVMFMKGYDWGRIMLAIALAISFYGPFVLLVVPETPAPPFMQGVYIVLMIFYIVLEYFVCLNKDVKTYFRR
ncbi:MAG: hypothetical protein ACI4JF_01650 [Oscillospiraceae bacterium]